MYKLGFCVYGPRCRFRHTRLPGPPPEPETVDAAKPREFRHAAGHGPPGSGPGRGGFGRGMDRYGAHSHHCSLRSGLNVEAHVLLRMQSRMVIALKGHLCMQAIPIAAALERSSRLSDGHARRTAQGSPHVLRWSMGSCSALCAERYHQLDFKHVRLQPKMEISMEHPRTMCNILQHQNDLSVAGIEIAITCTSFHPELS